MTNIIAIWLGIFVLGFFVLDHFVFHLDAMTFILRLLIETIAKIAFWR
tara:strand:- start:1175 stop:1318 length:144 start_codon:yes stop_codon:yes gene_type:complete